MNRIFQHLHFSICCFFKPFRLMMVLSIVLLLSPRLTAKEPVESHSQKPEVSDLLAKAKKILYLSPDSSALLYRQALDLAYENDNPEEQAQTMRDIGKYLIMTGRFDQAIDTLNHARTIAEKDGLKKLTGEAKSSLGVAYDYKGDYKKAIEYYADALDDFKLIQDTMNMSVVFLNTGIVYEEMGKADEAIEYYTKALEYTDTIADKLNIPVIMNNLGVVYMDLKKDYTKALGYFERALAILDEMGEKRGVSNIYNNIGGIYESKNDYKRAIESYQKALALNEENNEKQGIVNSLGNIGNLYLKTQEYNKSLDALIKGLSIASEIGYKKGQYEIYGAISEVYNAKGMYKEALQYNKLYNNLKDSVMNESLQEKMLDFQTKYETEKKNSEIAQLKVEKMKQEVTLKNQRMMFYSLLFVFILVSAFVLVLLHSYNLKKKANREKEILIKEIHHRVKNNLQTISSLLSLQNNYIANNEIKDIVNESQSRVKSMALIHQLLYQQEIGSKIDFEQYIHELCKAISEGYCRNKDNIECTLNCEQIYLDIDTAIPIGLIANELFINAYKYAFKDPGREGKILVKLSQLPDKRYLFTFKDNGVGLPVNITLENSQTLGLKLINILVKQIRGTITYKVDRGTEFNIVFDEMHR